MPTPPSTQTTSPHPEKKILKNLDRKKTAAAQKMSLLLVPAQNIVTRVPRFCPKRTPSPPPMCVGISNCTVQIGQRISFALGFSPSSCPMYKSAAWPKPWLVGYFAETWPFHPSRLQGCYQEGSSQNRMGGSVSSSPKRDGRSPNKPPRDSAVFFGFRFFRASALASSSAVFEKKKYIVH